jgi:hypothetical protein
LTLSQGFTWTASLNVYRLMNSAVGRILYFVEAGGRQVATRRMIY